MATDQAPKPDTARTAIDESPLLAWLDDREWNWTCDECGAVDSCSHFDTYHDVAAAAIVEMLAVLRLVIGAHRSTIRVAQALATDRYDPHAAECETCAQPWPCPAIVAAEKAARPVIEPWLADQPWWTRRWLTHDPARRRPRALDGTTDENGRTRCPHCDQDLTDGIAEWRTSVNSVFAYRTALEARLHQSIQSCSPHMPADFRAAEAEGLHLALSQVHTEFTVLLYSHHRHLDFLLAERNSGAINRAISI